jgi:hypothetical protein
MIRQSLVSAMFAVGLVLGFGCASADEASPESDSASDQDVQDEDFAEVELGVAEQASTLPIEEPPGGSVQCVAACMRYSTVNITGLCCTCNGAIKTFARHPAIPSMYLCR